MGVPEDFVIGADESGSLQDFVVSAFPKIRLD